MTRWWRRECYWKLTFSSGVQRSHRSCPQSQASQSGENRLTLNCLAVVHGRLDLSINDAGRNPIDQCTRYYHANQRLVRDLNVGVKRVRL